MATSQVQFRSISLPSRLHPINPTKYDQSQLQKLKSWGNTSCFTKEIPVNSETIRSNLLGLAELYSSVEKLTQSPSTQDRKAIEDSLEGSVDLLDSCSTIQELIRMMKENVQSLQSSFRRKGVDSSIQNDMTSYFYLRKKMNKSMAKVFKKLKNLENKSSTTPTNNTIGSNNLSVMNGDTIFIRVLREVMGVTIAIFKCILELFSWPLVKPNKGWFLVAKLTKSMASARFHHHGIIMSEVGSVDFALNSLQERIRNINVGVIKVVDLQMAQTKLQTLEFSMEGIEVGLERLFRHLLQSRVTLLNILTDQ